MLKMGWNGRLKVGHMWRSEQPSKSLAERLWSLMAPMTGNGSFMGGHKVKVENFGSE